MQKTNKLINEKSPYLLQHAHNPVDWYPWCDEAFNKAKSENKPIFLSIGYSTCHWCHVMERESFEDETVAKILNDNFISIKVDREERPDIDMIYMNFCTMLTGSGGWPLTIFMTPDKKPFFAGTYFPKKKYGRIGLIELLNKIIELWKNESNSIIDSSEKIYEIVTQSTNSKISNEYLDTNILKEAYQIFKDRYDKINGGFGDKPKFPIPQNYLFLLRYFHLTNDSNALDMVENSLNKMRLGGIYDQVGFGFHRYSTDEIWLVPHFEKMLYDQALMSLVYTELYQITKNQFYQNTAEEIFEYIIRDMTSPEGAFYSAEDADSEGVEGKFYLWKYDEIKNILGTNAEIFCAIYNISENGNFISDMHNSNDNILHLRKKLDEILAEKNIPKTEFEKMHRLLFDYRKKRVHPLKDDKILTDWNGLMIAAFAYASRVFNNNKYLQSATSAAEFILNNLMKENVFLLHRYRDGEAKIEGNLDDYAFFIWGLIELYQTSFNAKYLEKALLLMNLQIKNFWDETNGGFYFTQKKYNSDLIQRPKIYHDSAIPSGNSISMLNINRLYHITGNHIYEDYSKKFIASCADEVNTNPYYYATILSTYLQSISSQQEIVIVGERKDVQHIIDFINKKYNPNRVVLLKSNDSKLDKISSYTSSMKQIQNKPTVYICENFTCKLPINSLEELENNL